VTYRWLTDLDQVLTRAGVPFVEVPASSADPTGAASWRERGRPGSTGCFDPQGILCHHTASPAGTSDQADINGILRGNSEAPGPISTCYVGRTGIVYLVAAGRCNHGGKGIRPGIDSGCSDMNCLLLGIEAGNNGVGERWGDPMTTAYARLVKALCDGYGWGMEDVFLHATTGPPSGGCNSKIDPAGPWQRQPDLGAHTWDLNTWRSFVAEQGGSHPPIPPTPPTEDDMAKCIIHVDESQPAGSAGYWRFNAVWNWAGAWRYHLPSELGVKSAVYENTGDGAVFQAVLGDIVKNPAWVQPVGSLDGYGAVAGNDPGDI